jgi:hypothetical protein
MKEESPSFRAAYQIDDSKVPDEGAYTMREEATEICTTR